MYSYADRIRAVELYIKRGLRVRATIRQLGYPTRNALKAGISTTSSIMLCQQAKLQQHRNIRCSKDRWRLLITSPTIAVLLPR